MLEVEVVRAAKRDCRGNTRTYPRFRIPYGGGLMKDCEYGLHASGVIMARM